MKKYLALAMFVVLAVALVSPISVSAKTKAGVKSGSFFYFFDKTFEKANLFFTFNPEKKAKKALENAEERLAEAEESASENKPEAVTEAMNNHQKSIEVLEKVLAKVPEEAKQAIEKAIEADKERQDKMMKKIEEINNEIKNEDKDLKKDEEEKSNDDVGDNETGKEEVEKENKDENKKDEQSSEIEKLEKEVEGLKQKQLQVKIIEKITEKEKPIIIESKQSSSSQTSSAVKQNENIITLPNGSVVEMDENGNVVRTIKEAPQSTYVVPVPTVQNKTPETIQISLVNIVPTITSAKVEWETNQPTESKLYLSGSGLSSKLFASEAGYATKHFASITPLTPMTDYSFQITAIGNAGFANVFGGFKTKTPPPTIKFDQSFWAVPLGTQEVRISWKSTYTDSCSASGAWSGSKPTNGEEILSFNQIGIGNYVYTLTCVGKNMETIVESTTLGVIDYRPKITFYFNDIPSNTFSGKVGETVKLRWETSNTSGTNSCTASNSWSGSKYIGGSQDILFETAGEFSYTLTCIHGGSGESRTNTAVITVTQ